MTTVTSASITTSASSAISTSPVSAHIPDHYSARNLPPASQAIKLEDQKSLRETATIQKRSAASAAEWYRGSAEMPAALIPMQNSREAFPHISATPQGYMQMLTSAPDQMSRSGSLVREGQSSPIPPLPVPWAAQGHHVLTGAHQAGVGSPVPFHQSQRWGTSLMPLQGGAEYGANMHTAPSTSMTSQGEGSNWDGECSRPTKRGGARMQSDLVAINHENAYVVGIPNSLATPMTLGIKATIISRLLSIMQVMCPTATPPQDCLDLISHAERRDSYLPGVYVHTIFLNLVYKNMSGDQIDELMRRFILSVPSRSEYSCVIYRALTTFVRTYLSPHDTGVTTGKRDKNELFALGGSDMIRAIKALCNSEDPYVIKLIPDGFACVVRQKPLDPKHEVVSAPRIAGVVGLRRRVYRAYVEAIAADLAWLGDVDGWKAVVEWTPTIEDVQETVTEDGYAVGTIIVRFKRVDTYTSHPIALQIGDQQALQQRPGHLFPSAQTGAVSSSQSQQWINSAANYTFPSQPSSQSRHVSLSTSTSTSADLPRRSVPIIVPNPRSTSLAFRGSQSSQTLKRTRDDAYSGFYESSVQSHVEPFMPAASGLAIPVMQCPVAERGGPIMDEFTVAIAPPRHSSLPHRLGLSSFTSQVSPRSSSLPGSRNSTQSTIIVPSLSTLTSDFVDHESYLATAPSTALESPPAPISITPHVFASPTQGTDDFGVDPELDARAFNESWAELPHIANIRGEFEDAALEWLQGYPSLVSFIAAPLAASGGLGDEAPFLGDGNAIAV
ncbi:uncharacterized protein EV422DRAFT_563899 [Fimicolochytrium jonesii]|uniref:uncharacterized protein n=1 Tax=Fimicolochytrium jonesii TaxID=1396493 RepID=UPI0022FE68B9|nr:uncharacterized protein EV422DRAFT_563899 [Fimicolochytrium jonesii]KAI8826094.1 hypothetical protein EV422DRAFT_563899 [Fimicolochytrium jonesii]